MKAKTTFAVAVFAAVAGFAGMTFAAASDGAPCAPRMGEVYAQLAQDMQLSGPAKQAFDAYVAARQEIAGKHFAWHEANGGKMPSTRAEALKLRAEHMKIRADMLEQIAAAHETLDKSLTPEQQQFMNVHEPRYGMGMGPRAGMAPRHHRGPGCGYGPGQGVGYGPGCGYGPGFGPGCGAPGCVYGNGPRNGDDWGWHGPRHGYGQYGYGPGCRW